MVVIFCTSTTILIIVLAITVHSIKERNEHLQNSLDSLFSYNFSQLQEELFYKRDLSETSAAENSYMCVSIFSYTTFAENELLKEIVVALSNMVESDSQNARERIMDDTQLIENMGQLVLDLQNMDLAEKILSDIQKYI